MLDWMTTGDWVAAVAVALLFGFALGFKLGEKIWGPAARGWRPGDLGRP